jgi:hypothetical protein
LFPRHIPQGSNTECNREIAAGKRAAILEKIEQQLPDVQRRRANSAAAGYRKLETRYRLRREMYQTDNMLARMRQLFRLLSNGGYESKTHWGVGRKALVRDAICNVILKDRERRSVTGRGQEPSFEAEMPPNMKSRARPESR